MTTDKLDTFIKSRSARSVLHTLGAGLCSLLLAPAVWSASLAISDAPLFLTSGVNPNVFIELDDSGSMDWEILTRKYWYACDYDPNHPDDTYGFAGDICDSSVLDDGLWKSNNGGTAPETYEYIFNNSDAAYSQGCTGSRETLYSCNSDMSLNTPYQLDWRILSSDFNVMYFNPRVDYKPWLGPCLTNGTQCANASFTSARSNPREGTAGYTVTRNLDHFFWDIWVDTAGYTGSRPDRGNEVDYTMGANGEIDLWDTHITFEIDGNDVNVTVISYAPDATGLNPSTTSTTLTGPGCFTELASNSASCRTIAELKQNVANWYQYARKRQYVAKAGISRVITQVPGFRYGLDTINQGSNFIEVPAGLGNYATHNDSLLDELFSFPWPAQSTPLRQGLQRAGDYFDSQNGNNLGLTDPIEYSCQKNFTVLLTDGYWNGNSPGVGNVDGDGVSNTVADVARLYYNSDLSAFTNNVPPDAFDPKVDQHMVTFTLAFGVEGQLVDTDPPGTPGTGFGTGSGWPNPPLIESDNWGTPCDTCTADNIDDLWHAAYNSRGTFISAKTPGAVVTGLQNAIKDVQSRTGSASSVALNSGVINTNTKIYQARFVDSDWHGELLSIGVDPATGVPDTANAINVAGNIQAHGSRVMFTHDGSQGVLFDWTGVGTALNATQQTLLNTDAAGNTDTLGMARVGWLRGDSSGEQQNGGIFRSRTNGVLGDIINSAPVFVGVPNARYPDYFPGAGAPENLPTSEHYSTFKYNNASRLPMVYSGTNGGTVNGFDADFTATAPEKLAYVPSRVFNNLSKLPDPSYVHRYFVDGSPTAVDAFFAGDSSWHTVLAGGLNRGGQGIYALDITDPSSFAATAASAQNTVLWEFTDADDPDLGYTYSQPAIVRLHNGQWAAVFGNGYNNRDNDGNQSSTGDAVLFIVDIETGSLIKKLSTDYGTTSTPNGLATPAVIDFDGNFVADYVYAGDLEGNMWKFDITDPDPANWDVGRNGGVPEPLYVARDASNNRQPITVRPDIGRGPYGLDIMVYFGTGQYLQTSDLSDTSSQSFYGILDTGSNFTGRGSLGAQSVVYQGAVNGIPVRVTSDNATGTRGWYMDLPDSGERSVANPILRAGRIIFVTTVPSSDPCLSGGNSWLMELNALNGKRLDIPPFDLNGDGLFSLLDYVQVNFDVNGDGTVDSSDVLPPSGKGFSTLLPTPGILTSVNTEYKYTPTSSGSLEMTTENPGQFALGRQSWGQLR
ncbi:MAG: PilC/PilY family type IV pilus protein [Gammaproteobacteria bacterium]